MSIKVKQDIVKQTETIKIKVKTKTKRLQPQSKSKVEDLFRRLEDIRDRAQFELDKLRENNSSCGQNNCHRQRPTLKKRFSQVRCQRCNNN